MNTSIYKLLSQSLGFTEKQIEKTIELLDSGATIPFISRYPQRGYRFPRRGTNR